MKRDDRGPSPAREQTLFDLPTYLERGGPSPKLRCLGDGSPVALVTGASVAEFNPDVHHRTRTKAFFPGSDRFLCNVSLPFALRLARAGRRVAVQCHPGQFDTLGRLVATQEWGRNIRLLPADLGRPEWTAAADELIHDWSKEEPVSRVDLLLYESYTADVRRPFVPTWEEDVAAAAAAIERRMRFYKAASEYGYRLLLACGQPELRVVALTALASFRPVAYLFADGAHKVVSSKFLQTWALECKAHCAQPAAIVELCPGVVDTGLYDPPEVRTVAWTKASLNGQPFEDSVSPDDIESWPMLSPDTVAELGCAYFEASWGPDARMDELGGAHRALLSGGRGHAEMSDERWRREREAFLPLYASYPAYPWGEMPPLRAGYQPVFLAPTGQLV